MLVCQSAHQILDHLTTDSLKHHPKYPLPTPPCAPFTNLFSKLGKVVLSQSKIRTCRFSAEWSVDAPKPGLRNRSGSSRTSSSVCSLVSWIGLWGGVKCPDVGGVRPRPLDTAHQLSNALKLDAHTTTANYGNSEWPPGPRLRQESLHPTPSPLISESTAILPFTAISIIPNISSLLKRDESRRT